MNAVKQSGPAIGFLLAGVAFFIMWQSAGATGTPPVTMMLLVFGALAGWTVGILMTPEAANRGAFTAYGTAIITFSSGFLLAKVERVFELKTKDNAAFIDRHFLFGILVFGAAFVLGVLCTFVWRSYVSRVTTPPGQ
jgi:hypothetical protein